MPDIPNELNYIPTGENLDYYGNILIHKVCVKIAPLLHCL